MTLGWRSRVFTKQEDAFYSDLNALKKTTICPAEFININNNETRRAMSYLFPIPVNSASLCGSRRRPGGVCRVVLQKRKRPPCP
jgi:hypothetical protein